MTAEMVAHALKEITDERDALRKRVEVLEAGKKNDLACLLGIKRCLARCVNYDVSAQDELDGVIEWIVEIEKAMEGCKNG